MSKALIPLDVIASTLSADVGDSTLKHKFTFTRHLLDCYRDANIFMDNEKSIKTSVLDFDNAVNCPCDFIYETKVGVLYKGRLAVLTLDKDVKYGKANHTEAENYLNGIWDGSYTGGGYYFYNAYRGGDYLGEMYGLGRGVSNDGLYSIDRKQGVIYIGSIIPKDAEIVVEYVSDGVADGLKLVPVEMKKMMEYYALSEWYAPRNITQSQINRNNYEREYMRVKRLYNFQNALYFAASVNESFSPTNY